MEPGEFDLEDLSRALAGEFEALSPGQYALLTERDRLRARAARYRTSRDRGLETSELEAVAVARAAPRIWDQISSRVRDEQRATTDSPPPGALAELATESSAASGVNRIHTRIADVEHELEQRRSANESTRFP